MTSFVDLIIPGFWIYSFLLPTLVITQFVANSESNKQKRYSNPDMELHSPIDYEHHVPDYKFSYDVTSMNTGDIKSQHEIRDGGSVHGFYSLVEPDGTLREVMYTADDYHGFRATVKRYRHGILI